MVSHKDLWLGHGVLRHAWLQRDYRFHATIPGGRPFSAYILGLAFAFGRTPCIGPILGAILTVNGVSATVAEGTALLAIYAMGLGVPCLLVAAFTGDIVQRIRAAGRLGHSLQLVAGGVHDGVDASLVRITGFDLREQGDGAGRVDGFGRKRGGAGIEVSVPPLPIW